MSAVNYEVQKLKEIITLQKGKPPAQQPYFGTDANIYLTPEYLRGKALAESVKPSADAVHVNEGEIIVLWDGSNAGEFFKSRKGILASTMSCIKHEKIVDNNYFFYALKNCESYLKSQTSGSGIPHVDKEVLGNLEILLFSKSEQVKIAEILSTVDKAIEQTEALIAKQQRIKTGLMQDLLTRGIDEHGNLRSEKTHKFKNSPLGRIPVEWEVKMIGEVFYIQLGKMLSQKAVEGHAPFYYLGNKNIQWDYIDISGLQIMDFNEREQDKFELKAGDILVCEGGEIGRTAIWRNEVDKCYFQKAIHRLRPIRNMYLPDLFPRFMKWAIMRGFLSDYISQTSIAHLTQEKLATVPIIVQGMSEQRSLNSLFNKLDNELGILAVFLKKLYLFKTALMQDLLTGKKRVVTNM